VYSVSLILEYQIDSHLKNKLALGYQLGKITNAIIENKKFTQKNSVAYNFWPTGCGG
jgi:hypothetical protein